MVYKELTKKDFLKVLGLPSKRIPKLLVVDGNWRFEERFHEFSELIRKPFKTKEPFINRFCRFGFVGKVPVAFSCVYGPALASEMVHVFSLLGTKAVVQIGSFDGLQKGMRTGDFLVPTWVGKGDGASLYYPHRGKADSTGMLRGILAKNGEKEGFRIFEKPSFSSAAMLTETKSMIRGWNKKGFWGVDMETAATFAVAKHFNVPRAALLYLSDNVIEDQHVFMKLAFEDKERKTRAKEKLLSIALQSGIEFLKNQKN